MPEVSFSLAGQLLQHAISARVPTFLSGPPGIGKSSLVHSVTQQLGLNLLDVRVALLDAVDLRGLPFPDQERRRTQWLPPEFLPPMDSREKGILFLDEINAAPPNVQAACYQLVLDRRVGEYVLPDGWTICAAGNRTTDKTVAYAMPSALRNRFLTIELRADLQEWLDWASGSICGTRRCHQLITEFISFRPSLLLDLPDSCRDSPFPSPRSWMLASAMLAQVEREWALVPPPRSGSREHELLRSLLEGTVGHASADLLDFLELTFDRRFVAAFLADPERADVPREAPARLVLIAAIAERVRCDADGARRAARFLMQRMLEPEWREKLRSDIVRRCPDMLREPGFRPDAIG
jgi:hypothetical protein